MEFTSNELSLMSILSTQKTPVPAIELAEKLGVSTKTIYRTMKHINKMAQVEVVISFSGKGLMIDYENYLTLNLHESKYSDSEKRRMEVLLRLLYLSPKSIEISYLFYTYFLSESVIANDIAKMNDTLNQNGLILERKTGRIAVIGEETCIRNLIEKINQDLGVYNKLPMGDRNINSYDIDFVTNLFEKMEAKIGAHLTHPYNVNIFSHLFILVQRGRHGFINQHSLQQDFISAERDLIQKNYELYRIAEETINSIRTYLNIRISSFENFYLFFHLLSSRFDQKNFLEEDNDDAIQVISKRLLDKVCYELGIELDNSESISEFTSHLRALIFRLKNNFSVKNELLNEIKNEWFEVFEIVSKISKQLLLDYGYQNISDDEIGFLTLYFVKYKEEAESLKKVLIMCSSGVGTSELLKTRVIKSIPNIEVVDVLSVHLYEKRKQDFVDIDLILTTVNYNDFGEIPFVLVSVLFNEQDIIKVRNVLGGI